MFKDKIPTTHFRETKGCTKEELQQLGVLVKKYTNLQLPLAYRQFLLWAGN